MKTDSHAALKAAKIRRAEATTALAEAVISATADRLDQDLCQGRVSTLEQARSNAVAAAKPDDVIAVDGELLCAKVAVEIAASRATTATAKHAAAVTAMSAAKTEVEQCARSVIDSELIALADEVERSLDVALSLGAQLQAFSARNFLNAPLSVGVPTVPDEVTRALERLPQPNALDMPLNMLRGGGVQGDGWARRLAELTAADNSVAA